MKYILKINTLNQVVIENTEESEFVHEYDTLDSLDMVLVLTDYIERLDLMKSKGKDMILFIDDLGTMIDDIRLGNDDINELGLVGIYNHSSLEIKQ
ncbi:hypothetical protein N9043_00250 [bacterium]|nr:hypothetical protein [bacterium]